MAAVGAAASAAGCGAKPPGLHLFLDNVRGLSDGGGSKLASLLHWANTSHFNVFGLLETHLPDDPLAWLNKQPGAPGGVLWQGSYFWSPGTAHSKGVLVLFKSSAPVSGLPPSGAQVHADLDGARGRAVRVDFVSASVPFTLCVAYAPNTGPERVEFFRSILPAFLPAGRMLLLGADFNCVVADADRSDGASPRLRSQTTRHQGADALQALSVMHDLQDVWRLAAGPTVVDFTHWSGRHLSGARLDRWLVSGDLLQEALGWNPTSTILQAGPVHTDHLPVALSLVVPDPTVRYVGAWKFPLKLLADGKLVMSLVSLIRQHVDHCAPGQASRVWGELKNAIARHTQVWSRESASQRRRILADKVRSASRAKSRLLGIAAVGGDVSSCASTWRASAAAVTQVHQEAAKRALSSGHVLDHLYGDTSTYWFHMHGRTPPAPTSLTTLRASADSLPHQAVKLDSDRGVLDALEIAVAHFAGDSPTGLFRPKEGIDLEAQRVVLSRVTKRLTAGQAAACERPAVGVGNQPSMVTADELLEALKRCQRGKAPGLDGLPYEFYVVFWSHLGGFVARVFNEAFASPDSDALAGLLEGLICPVHKPDRVRDHLSGFRPITLLNTDVKLLSKAVADRLHLPLDFIVSRLQSAFIEGRDIAENVLYHLGLAEFLRDSQHPAWLLITDLAGAYDNVDRDYLLACLATYGFKVNGHVRWAALLHTGSQGRVTINGRISRPFPILSGLAQGAPASTVYWTVVCEPLVQRINSLTAQGRIATPSIPGCERLGPMVFADDIKQCVVDASVDGAVIVETCAEFRVASGVPLNVEKCVAVPLSPSAMLMQPATTTDPPVRVPGVGFIIPPADKPKKLLGIPFTANYTLAKQAAFGPRLGSMVAASGAWAARSLNFIGRAHVAKQCIGSVSTYHASFLRPDVLTERKMQSVCRGFAARSAIPGDAAPLHGANNSMQPRELIAALPWKFGGANLVHLPSHHVGLAAKNIARVFGPRRHPMRALMLHALAEADTLTAMPTWVVTDPNAPDPCQKLHPRLRDYVQAMRETRPHRIVKPEVQDFFSSMTEPLAHNRQILECDEVGNRSCFDPSSLKTPLGRSWRYVRDLRSAHTSGPAISGNEHADLGRALAALPLSWRLHVQRDGPLPPAAWSTTSLAGGMELVCRGDGPPVQAADVYVVLDMGRMELAGDVPIPPMEELTVAVWSPCLVLSMPKPPRHWTPEDHEAVLQAKRDDQEFSPHDWWCMGPWDSLLLDPSVWGHGDTPLHLYEVKTGRLRCLQLKASAKLGGLFCIGVGVKPLVWDPCPPSSQHAQASNRAVASALRAVIRSEASMVLPRQHDVRQRLQLQLEQQHQPLEEPAQAANGLTGLAALEQAWVAVAASKRHIEEGGRPPGEQDSAASPSWMQPSPAHRDSVLGRRQRDSDDGPLSQARLQPRALADLDDVKDAVACPKQVVEYQKAWKRLRDKGLSRVHRVTAWRIMHGALLVNALRCSLDARLPSSSACCTHSTCLQARVVETLTHTFLDCPAARPVFMWLQDVWEAVAEERPPLDARVLLADDHRVWKPGGGTALGCLWTLLRIATLHAVWHCRTWREQLVGTFCSAAAARVVEHVCMAVERDWLRATHDVRVLSDLPADYFRGRDPSMDMEDFVDTWTHRGVLCDIANGALILRFSLLHPVAAPV